MSWGLAFGLPWTLAYFYFIWICPAHQLTMGIRKLKPYRMLWWVASTGFHIVLLGIGLASTTSISSSYLHIDHASHLKPVVFLSLILAILIFMERNRLEAQPERTVFSDSIDASPERSSPPPPAYADLVHSPEKSPPKYEDLVFK